MTGINDINTAVYKILKGSEELTALCRICKGEKRPSRWANPVLTVSAKRLEPGQGAGIKMCDIAITVHADLKSNRVPDYDIHSGIERAVRSMLSDREIEIDGVKALPLIEGESGEPKWDGIHEQESSQEMIYGLVYVDFTTV